MTTITIEITDEQARQLTEEAARLQTSLEKLAAQRLLAPWQSEGSKPDFDAAMDYVFAKNAELYRRLA